MLSLYCIIRMVVGDSVSQFDIVSINLIVTQSRNESILVLIKLLGQRGCYTRSYLGVIRLEIKIKHLRADKKRK